jgi:hypothetical protein
LVVYPWLFLGGVDMAVVRWCTVPSPGNFKIGNGTLDQLLMPAILSS